MPFCRTYSEKFGFGLVGLTLSIFSPSFNSKIAPGYKPVAAGIAAAAVADTPAAGLVVAAAAVEPAGPIAVRAHRRKGRTSSPQAAPNRSSDRI